jgi:hypothetical protein
VNLSQTSPHPRREATARALTEHALQLLLEVGCWFLLLLLRVGGGGTCPRSDLELLGLGRRRRRLLLPPSGWRGPLARVLELGPLVLRLDLGAVLRGKLGRARHEDPVVEIEAVALGAEALDVVHLLAGTQRRACRQSHPAPR